VYHADPFGQRTLSLNHLSAAYAVAFPPANPADLRSMAREVIPIKPGEAAGSADKQLTAVLVSAKEPHKLIRFGTAARELLAELTDNPDERVEP
jgi:hypothetical protein